MTGVDASGNGGMTLSTLNLGRGYYRTLNESRNILKCHQQKACIGGVEASDYSRYQGVCETVRQGASCLFYPISDDEVR